MNDSSYIEPVPSEHCFCCGRDNERGLHLQFSYPERGKAEATLTIPRYFSGWHDVVHGGFLSMLLDEAMAHACRGSAAMAVTGEIKVKFRSPLHIGDRATVYGEINKVRGKLIETAGRIEDENGTCCAESSARFLVVESPYIREKPE